MSVPNPFEEKLRQQDLRSIPAEWKYSILAEPTEAKTNLAWRELSNFFVYPYRPIYVVLALLWIGIALLRFDTPESSSSVGTVASTRLPMNVEVLAQWQEKQRNLIITSTSPTSLHYIIR